MLFVISCLDDPSKPDLRMATRGAHLDYVAASGELVRAAGPYIADDGVHMIGSLIVLEAPDRPTAEAWSQNDPYVKVGLFKSVTITAWKWTIRPPADLAPEE